MVQRTLNSDLTCQSDSTKKDNEAKVEGEMAGHQDEKKSIPPRETTKGGSNQNRGNASDEVRDSCDPPTHASSSKDKADQCPDSEEHDDGSSSSSKVSSSKSWPAQICNSFCFKVPHGCGAVSGLLTKTVPIYLTLKS